MSEAPGGVLARRQAATPFQVHLGEVFEGPFDLLLGLIGKHRLDVTEIALSKVTDEFIAHIRRAQAESTVWDLDQASDFLLVAATLLDLKASRLVPSLGGEVEEDLELIEARDLLFARLLQYRAFKDMASHLQERMFTHGRLVARQAGLEERFSSLLPELVLTVGPQEIARLAAQALTPKEPPTVAVDHLHAVQVSVREQAGVVTEKLRERGRMGFADLVADAENTLVVVARFLAVLELFKEAAVRFEQAEHLAPLTVCWTATEDVRIVISDEFDGAREPVDNGHEAGPDEASVPGSTEGGTP